MAMTVSAVDSDVRRSQAWQSEVGRQVITYSVLLFSIPSSRFLDLYRAGTLPAFRLDIGYLLFVAIAALLVFPSVYDKAKLHTNQPLLQQIAVIFAAGMGWEKVLATVTGR